MNYKSIGITGTRGNISQFQSEWLDTWLTTNTAKVLHHGDCIGADDMAALKFHRYDTYIIAHPGLVRKEYRAHCTANDLVMTSTETHRRNFTIVKLSDLLLAFPSGPEKDFPRSGTWQTIRIARRFNRSHIIVYPQGPPESFFETE